MRYINRTSHTVTEITDYPDSDTNAEQENIYGLLQSSTDKSGITTTFQYDALERRIGVTDPRTGQSITHYNSQGQVDYTEDAAGNRTEYSYDPVTGRKTSVTDAENRTVYFLYDDLDRVTHTWGATTPVRYEYDQYGRMDAMHSWRSGEGWGSPTWPSANDGLADITRWHYHEASGLLESKEDAQNKSTQYTYLEGGRLHTRTWARTPAITTTYSYDPNTGELTGIDYSDTTPDIGFTYNRTGQRSTVTDAVGTRTFAYTPELQPDTESITGLISRTLTRSYETTGVPGRNTGFSTDSSYAVTYGYDNTGRFNGVSWNVGTHSDSVTYARVPQSHLLQTASFASGASTAYTFEPNRNLRTSVQNQYSTATISQYDYTHDNIGRRTSATMTGDVFENPALPPAPDELLMIDTDTTTSVGYSANDLNQYTSVDTNGSAASPAYDEDGSLTDDGTFSYTWNGENRLITITPKTPAVGDEKLEFLYDYMGRRVRKVTTVWDGSTWQTDDTALFVYNGWNMIEELDGTGAVTASYIHGLDLSQSLQGAGGIGGILARIDHGVNKSHIYFYDANGNVGQLVDSLDGSVVAAYEYAPFGGLVSGMGNYAEANPFRFSTKYADDVAGLYYYGYRYYSPELGRWMSRDPIGEDGGVNLYGFVGNDGVNGRDYLGQEGIGKTLKSFAQKTGVTAYSIVWQGADTFNNVIFFPLLDILALPDELIKCVFGLTDDDLLALSAQIPGQYDEVFFGVIIGGGKLPRFARKLLARRVNNKIDLYHGSIDNASVIKSKGFDMRKNATYTSPDYKAAQDAIDHRKQNFPHEVTDPDVIKSSIPESEFNSLEEGIDYVVRPYGGFYGADLDSSEILLKSDRAKELYNKYIVK